MTKQLFGLRIYNGYMHQHETEPQVTELTREIKFPGDLYFDADAVSLRGHYGDQLSAYRARKAWKETLETCFLLDPGSDYELKVRCDVRSAEFILTCHFESACARYAFWRLTNHQAPEAQYLLEIAHIPSSDSRHEDLLAAGDLKSILDEQIEEVERQRGDSPPEEVRQSLLQLIRSAMRTFVKVD